MRQLDAQRCGLTKTRSRHGEPEVRGREKLQKIRRRDIDKAFHIDTDWGIDHLNQIERVVTRLQMMWMSSSPRRGSESQRREVLK